MGYFPCKGLNSAAFTFHASETATFACKLDSGSYSSCTSPKNYTSLSDQEHTFYVKAIDTATNQDSTPESYTFTVDTIAPELTMTSSVPSLTNDSTPGFTFNSTEAGIIDYHGSCSSSVGAAVVDANLIILDALADDTYTDCTLDVTDEAGNISNTLTISPFIIDTAFPSITTGSPSGELPSGTTSAMLSVSTTEDSLCKYGAVANTDFASMTSIFDVTGNTTHTQTITGLSPGVDYRYYARCQDLADNLMTSDYTISFSIASAPSISSDSHKSHHHKKKTVKKRNIKNTFSKVTNGGTINPTGKHFGKNNTVLLYFSKSNGVFYLYKRVPTDSKGNFSISLLVNKPRGFYSWYAVDQKTGKKSNVRHYTVK